MNNLKIDYYHHQDLLALTRMSGLDALSIPAPLSMTAVQKKLAADELVLHYMLTDQVLYLLLISRDKVVVKQLASRMELDQALQTSIIPQGSNSIGVEELLKLSRLLFHSSTELRSEEHT